MEATKLQHLNVQGAVSSNFSLMWSEDDKLAITTVEGVMILVFDPDPGNDKWKFTFRRSKVAFATSNPSDHIGIRTDDLASTGDRLDVYNLILDAPIDPTLNGLPENPAQPAMAVWSPAGTLANSRCVLATVDVYGQASLIVPDVAGSHETIDLTALWVARCKKNWSEVDDSTNTRIRELVSRSMQLRTTAIAWAPRQEGDQVTGLVMSQRDGSLVWLEITREGDVSIVNVAAISLGTVHTLALVSGRRAVVGGLDGRVSLVADTGVVTSLWGDADLVAVSWMHCLVELEVMVVLKGNFVVVVSLNDASTAAEGIDCLFIGGAVPLNKHTIVIATQSGTLLTVTVSRRDGSLVVTTAPITWAEGAPGTCGLARSRNAAIWAVLGSHVDCYDCTPTQLSFLHIPALTPDPVTAIGCAQSVWQARDQLELLRSVIMHRRMEGSCLLARLTLPPAPARWDGLPPAQLRVWRWLTLVQGALETRLSKKDERPITAFPYNKHRPLYKEVLRIEHLLTLDNCCRRITELVKKPAELSPEEKLSLSLMRCFLASVVESSKRSATAKTVKTEIAETASTSTTETATPEAVRTSIAETVSPETAETASTETAETSSSANESIEIPSSETTDGTCLQPDKHSTEPCQGGQPKKCAKKLKGVGKKGKARVEPVAETRPVAERPAESDEVMKIEEEREPGWTCLLPGPALDRVVATLELDVGCELPAEETCALCSAEARLTSATTSLCTAGHTLPRCSLSLRQLLQVPYLLCARCDLMALPGVDVAPACIFCGAPLELLQT